MSPAPTDSRRHGAAETPRSPSSIEEVESRELLGTNGQLVIHHQGRRYVLRQTRLGKLILTT